jgi:periplasmic protein TonB
MHGTLDRDAAGNSEVLFYAEPSVSAATAVEAPVERCTYGTSGKPNWVAIASIVMVHLVSFYALVKLDVIHIAEKKKPLVVELIAEPPAPPPEKPQPEPEIVQKIEPTIVTPAPIVQTLAPPPPIAVTNTPPPVKPVAVAAPPAQGPVTVGNLDERLLDGKPPRYPMESRRKHEQGTVVLRIMIGTDGRVQEISIAESSGFARLDQAALQAVRTWRWQPFVREGQAVEVRGLYSMPFSLQG